MNLCFNQNVAMIDPELVKFLSKKFSTKHYNVLPRCKNVSENKLLNPDA